ncbi:Diaminobutyrate--2-oxoglutarate transaminase protein [Marine Group I thaumarchaeote SCGC RSA3]|uniref:Diaminobutyrate--2-oxoglutarate transaminase protein n=4 Tax=Marine Group I TaxID=905826 RepID=A0A081RMV4_9ARCH|nr:Diaminobutyrate--2-oxoglutarate transaminase protein [Marine Group I thaumarchaeote SCGC AAA799-N04]KFM15580.1 Diaminobutyrate--2-oxoglutarate transaminase protein [Marine Group I thaumarchaeote SCGC AAA799-D11]KFM16780.1 Diaminobutyrate--2-oxoglutarate transaminase protein [Marine Group I thaumarchaeote SCGC RSA3]
MNKINSLESKVRSYCRAYPVMFTKAKNSHLIDKDGKKYLDFLCGAGSLNYGHNNPDLKNKVIDYLNQDGIIHSLDLATESKEEFLDSFSKNILSPRNLDYKIQFTGPTGTNAVEAALKIARKVTGRTKIISFTNGFHGVTLGSVAATGNKHHRGGAGISLNDVMFMPFDGYMGKKLDTIDYLRRLLEDNSSGIDLPAAVILETVQGEGGINIASSKWLQSLQELCREFGILIIVDDIQVGCGRTGTFFSFEGMGITPDLIVLSKSLSGFGLPFSLLLLKPELDKWKPGEHNGTFRGNNLAFVTAKTAIEQYWTTDELEKQIILNSKILQTRLEEISAEFPSSDIQVRGKGMIYGIDCILGDFASEIRQKCFENGLILETCGADDQVVKLLPPLNISEDDLMMGLDILETSIKQVISESDFDKLLEAEVIQK